MQKENSLKNRLLSIYINPYFPIFIFIASVFLLILDVQIQIGNDDAWFHAAITEQGAWNWVFSRYFTWGGRFSIELVLALINYNMPLWKILNSIMAGLLIYGISKYILNDNDRDDKKRTIIIFLCGSMYLMYPYVFASSIIWTTGSFNYLWTATALIFAMLPYYYQITSQNTKYKVSYLGYYIASFYASYFEQTSAILICFGLISFTYTIFMKKKLNKVLIVNYIFILLNSAICFLAPGITARLGIENHWYPNYVNISPLQRLFEVVNWTNTHVLITSSFLALFLALFIFLLYKSNTKVLKLLSLVPLLYVLLRIIPFNALFSRVLNFQHGLTANLNNYNYNPDQTLNIEFELDKLLYDNMKFLNGTPSFGNLFPSIFSLTIIIFIGFLLFFVLKDKNKSFVCTVIYCAALASGYSLFMSPTIYASGSRIFFVGTILLITILGFLLKEISDTTKILQNKNLKYFNVCYIVIVGCIYCSYFTNYSQGNLTL